MTWRERLKATLLLRQAAHLIADAEEHEAGARDLRDEASDLLRQATAIVDGEPAPTPRREPVAPSLH